MKKSLICLLMFSLCSCHEITTTPLVIDEGKIDDDIELFNYTNDSENKNKYLAELEANLIDDAKIFPLNTSNHPILTYAVKSKNNPIIINGKNYYKIKNHIVTNNIVSNTISNSITNECYKDKISYYEYAKNQNIDINSVYTIPFIMYNVSSLDYYSFNNPLQNEVLLQCNDSLLEIDIFGNVINNLAESYSISDDKLNYTFKLKDNAYFIDNNGNRYSKIKAEDYVTGFDYMIANNINTSLFKDVTIKAIDDTTLQFALDYKDSDFIYKIANNSILPMNLEFFESKGGILYPTFVTSGNYGKISSISNSLYTGAYYPTLINDDRITLKLNPNYYQKDISIQEINYIKDNVDLINKFNNNIYSEIQLTDKSIVDENLLNYKYVDSSIRYVLINSKRENYEVYNSNIKTNKTLEEIDNCKKALNNINFRKALLSCIDTSLFSLDNKDIKINNLSLYDVSVIVNNRSILYSSYVKSIKDSNINYNLTKAKRYYEKFINEASINTPIIIDVLCFKDSEEMNNNIKTFKDTIESTLGKDNIKIDIIYCDNTYEYYLAGHHKYQCYDLYFDFTINLDYNSRYKYLKEIIKYI